jgi:UDP-glucose 4-epimerase
MKVLITGGAGFIGSHIVDALLGQQIETVVVDNLSTGLKRNINTHAVFYQVDILAKRLSHVFRVERPDVVIHEAAQTDVSRSVREPLYDARMNILGSINVLENCIKFNVRKVVYASSCAIYGTPQYVPIDEEHPLNSISPYGVSKQTVEKYLHAYHKTHGLEYCALRYSNVYGPRQNPGGEAGVVAIFSHQMLSGQQPKIYGNGNKTRSYVYVDDIVKANLLALNSRQNGIFNLGTPTETTDKGIFDLVSRACCYGGNPRYVEERPGEIRRMCLNSNKAAKYLGWAPQTGLEEGIAETVKSFNANYGNEISSFARSSI